jgi:threonylcarbamoyladenosine tRNA methylthiotransferase MtaB
MKKTVAFCTLGCKVNQYETDAMRGSFEAEGYEVKEFSQEASVYVINTCTVTNMADRKSRQMMHRAKKKNPDGIIVAVGCYVQAAKEQLEEDTLIDLVIGNNMKSQVVQIIGFCAARSKNQFFLFNFQNTCKYFSGAADIPFRLHALHMQ